MANFGSFDAVIDSIYQTINYVIYVTHIWGFFGVSVFDWIVLAIYIKFAAFTIEKLLMKFGFKSAGADGDEGGADDAHDWEDASNTGNAGFDAQIDEYMSRPDYGHSDEMMAAGGEHWEGGELRAASDSWKVEE